MMNEIPALFCLKHFRECAQWGKGGLGKAMLFFSLAQKLASLLPDRPTGLEVPHKTEQRTSSKVIISNLPDF